MGLIWYYYPVTPRTRVETKVLHAALQPFNFAMHSIQAEQIAAYSQQPFNFATCSIDAELSAAYSQQPFICAMCSMQAVQCATCMQPFTRRAGVAPAARQPL